MTSLHQKHISELKHQLNEMKLQLIELERQLYVHQQRSDKMAQAFETYELKLIEVNPLVSTQASIARIMALPLTHQIDASILDRYKADFFCLECLYELFLELASQ